MVKIYECLNCGNDVPLPSCKTDVKFCSNDCYKIKRKEIGTVACAQLQPIFKREDKRPHGKPFPKKDNDAPVTSIPQEPAITPPLSEDNKNIEQQPDTDPEGQQNASIDFDDLSISDLKIILSDLLIQNEALQTQVEHLSLLINNLEQSPSPLKKIVNSFLKELIHLEIGEPSDTATPTTPNLCAVPGCKNLTKRDNIFCSKKCAKSMLTSPNSRMILNSGEMIGGDL